MKSFFVSGKCEAQGSMRAFNNRLVHNKSKELNAWRNSVAQAAKIAKVELSLQPISLTLTFTLAKPKSVKRALPTVPPDLDKLIRAIGDALTGIAWKDDSQITTICATKVYGDTPGVKISILDIQ